jgi:hypothetical protein
LKKLFLLLLFCGCAHGVERVTAFHSDIRVASDGTLTVTETIEVQAEGKQIRRGILRDFPTHYRDRYGNRMTVPLEVFKVMRNGEPEPFALERLTNGTRIRIGEASRRLANGKHVYRIVYGTERQIGFFGDHDELYWNVNGTGWTFAFDRITAEVTLPERVPAGDIKVEAFTGPQGARGHDFNAFVRHGSAAFRASRPLAPGEGMTISVGFPKGVVAQPSRAARFDAWLSDNPAAVAGAGGLLLLGAYLLFIWGLVGRDPKAGPQFPRYEPPPGLAPGGVRYLDRMGYDNRCFAAALLGLGAGGFLRIRQAGERYDLEPTAKALDGNDVEQRIAIALFHAEKERVSFGREHSPALQRVRDAFRDALPLQYRGRLFSRNLGAQAVGWAIAAAVLLALWVLNAPLLLMSAFAILMAALLVIFYFLLPAYSIEGRKLQDAVEGLRQYLSVAEKDDLARMKAPPQTPQEFARFLPYAVALGVEKTWADRFAAILGTAAVAAAVSEYYSSSDGGFSDSGFTDSGFTDSLSSMDSSIASASTPPGSSDGGGGNGSSGGGGGGGGGSGW